MAQQIGPVAFHRVGQLGLIRVCNPPVNAISQPVRAGLIAAVEQLEDDADIKAAVIYCDGRTFMAGADVKEFGKPALAPSLPEVCSAIAASSKPILAAIHGQALGGGLEIALACRYRVALANAKLGLPEVKLGLIPGAGGTQRLAGLIGLEKAIDMVTLGRSIEAAQALQLGLLDRLLPADCEDIAHLAGELLEDLIDQADVMSCRFSDQQLQAQCSEAVIAGWRAKLAKRCVGQPAPIAALEAIEIGVVQGLEAGLKAERAAFLSLRESPQAKAMQHLFFAEKQAAKLWQKPSQPTVEIRQVAVVGAGTMGCGIAQAFAAAGVEVLLLENSAEALARGVKNITAAIEKAQSRGIYSAAEAGRLLRAIRPVQQLEELGQVDMLIEAVFEDMQVKKQLFAEYQRHCPQRVIWATNTSYLDINEMALSVERPENFLGVHFFSPANIMPLVEVIDAQQTSLEALAAVLQLLKKMGKIGVISGVCHGFIGNRIYQAYQREAGLLLLEGATPSQVDGALTDFGMAMGPFAVLDMSGIDIGYMMRQSLADSRYEKSAFLLHDKLVESGRKGRKSGLGFYNYQLNGAGHDDLPVLEMLAQISAEQGVERRQIETQEIRDRCLLALVNEASLLLDEGIARCAADIDVVYANGYGFPRALGGPMFYAQQQGIAKCAAQINEFAHRFGDRWWRASSCLTGAAQSGSWS